MTSIHIVIVDGNYKELAGLAEIPVLLQFLHLP